MQKTVTNIEEMMIYMKLGRDNCIARGLNNRRILQNSVRKWRNWRFRYPTKHRPLYLQSKGGEKDVELHE
jgi:hypothetical protein